MFERVYHFLEFCQVSQNKKDLSHGFLYIFQSPRRISLQSHTRICYISDFEKLVQAGTHGHSGP